MLEAILIVFVVVVALVSLAQLLLLGLLIYLVWKLKGIVSRVPSQVSPVLQSAQQTATAVQGTANFMATRAAGPLIRMLALIAATERFVQVLVGSRRRA
ncbi:MAG: hypothetical protein HYY04_17850 [Chloroflexi bacterium]|nr:hypothetical protein [Chloroflexota bacterium]